jgi:hypothetical protein
LAPDERAELDAIAARLDADRRGGRLPSGAVWIAPGPGGSLTRAGPIQSAWLRQMLHHHESYLLEAANK